MIDPDVIEELYRASQAGVQIDLIVRGMCSLRPGVAGVSERIRVLSIVDRYLEHARVFYFQNGGEPLYLLASADWMQRNFDRRVEIAFPIIEPALQNRLKRDSRNSAGRQREGLVDAIRWSLCACADR